MKKMISLLLLLVVVAAGAWFLAVKMQSSEQVAAQAEPPKPKPVISELQRGYLHKPISTSLEANYSKTIEIQPPETLDGVVTSVEKKRNKTVKSGDLLLRVNGDPVFVLEGPFTLYRDIPANTTGDDVAALQTALNDVGYSTGYDETGTFGPGTQAAVQQMYSAAGLIMPTEESGDATEGDSETESDDDTADSSDSDESGADASTAPTPVVKQNHIMMVPKLPGKLMTITSVGTEIMPEEPIAKLGSGDIKLTTDVPTNSVESLEVGAEGTFTDDDGEKHVAEVTKIESTDEDDAAEVRLEMTTDAGIPSGDSVVVTIDNPGGEEDEALLAPHAGIVDRGGHSYIYVAEGEKFTEVEVTIIDSAGGVAAIEADEDLDEGTEIRVE